METKRLMSVNEFCRQHSLSRTTFYSEVRTGKLRIVKRGRRTFVASEDAEAWVQSLRDELAAKSKTEYAARRQQRGAS